MQCSKAKYTGHVRSIRVVSVGAAVLLLLAPSLSGAGLAPEADATWRGGTLYNASGVLGLFTKSNGTADRAYLEFQLPMTAAGQATLRLYNYWGTPQGKTVNYNVRIRGTGSSEPGYVQWTDQAGPAPSGSAHEDGANGNPLWTIVADSFQVDSTPRWYEVDITTFYNSHLGQKVTFSVRALSGSGDGPIFVDREGTGGSQLPEIQAGVVVGVPPLIAEVSPDPDTVYVGVEYQRQLALVEGTSPVTWSVLQGPPGLSVDASGLVSGWTPAGEDGQPFTIEVQAANDYGADQETWQVAVLPRPESPPRVFPGAAWESRSPAEVGMDAALLDQVAAAIGGIGCIVRNGYMVKTWGTQSVKADWASAAKPVLSTMLFYAVMEGKLAGVDDRIADWGWALSAKDQSMTFRHLADMTSGYTRAEAPGAAWAYNDYAISLYSRTLFDRVFAQTPNTAATDPNRLGALQFQDGSIFSSRGGYGLSTSVRDYARIGWMWAGRGYWNGTRLIPKQFFDDFRHSDVPPDLPRTAGTDPAGDYLGVTTYGGGSDQTAYGPGIYGFNWWFNGMGGLHPTSLAWPDAPTDTFQANGHWGKEVVTVMPSLRIVMAYFGGATLSFQPGSPSSSANQVLKLLQQSVIRTVLPDLDGDGDVDVSDFGALQACLTDEGELGVASACDAADFDADWRVDQRDVDVLLNCLSGADIAADPTCDNLLP